MKIRYYLIDKNGNRIGLIKGDKLLAIVLIWKLHTHFEVVAA